MNEEKEQNTRKNVKHTKLVIGLANKQLGYTHARASGSNGHRYTFLMWTRHAIPRNTHVQTDHTLGIRPNMAATVFVEPCLSFTAHTQTATWFQ